MLSITCKVLVIGFLVALISIVAIKMLLGKIVLSGLIHDKETNAFSPGRLQLLVVTVTGAISYYSSIFVAKDLTAFPPVPTELLVILGISNAGYLGGKIYSRRLFHNVFDLGSKGK